jgi:RimJ/RimL family protein N-acetyltransferase
MSLSARMLIASLAFNMMADKIDTGYQRGNPRFNQLPRNTTQHLYPIGFPDNPPNGRISGIHSRYSHAGPPKSNISYGHCILMNRFLRSVKVTLKKPDWDDMEFIEWLWSDPETMDPVGGPILLNEKEAKAWFERMIDPGSNADSYFLILNEAVSPIGEISFHRLDSSKMIADFNIKIAASYRRMGYAQEAMVLFLDYFFNEFGGLVLVDKVARNNLSGQQALLNFGFRQELSTTEYLQFKMTREVFKRLYS